MTKVICCNWVHPAGCDHTMRGETVEEVLALAEAHARDHGIEPSPELLDMVREYIEDE